MQRGLIAVAAAALLCGVCFYALSRMVAAGAALEDIVLITCAVTLFLAATATGFSIRAMLRASAAATEMTRLSRSVDTAMRDLSARSNRDSATIEEINAFVSRELEAIAALPQARQKPTVEPAPQRDNIVALPAAKRSKPEPIELPTPPARPEQTGFELAVQRAFATGKPELSLQPIVSISQGAATGFEVYAHVERDDGMSIDLQRLPSSLPGVSQAAFERWLVTAAIEAARHKVGAASESMPLHVQISEALLSDSDELAAVMEAFRQWPAATAAIVLSLPSSVLERGARHVEALEMLVDAGVRMAAESWSGAKEGLDRLKRNGVSIIKLSADRLLGRTKLPKTAISPARLVETATAADFLVIAINVAIDEDAVSLIDLGVNQMTGNRFSGPRRLKPQERAQPERLANF